MRNLFRPAMALTIVALSAVMYGQTTGRARTADDSKNIGLSRSSGSSGTTITPSISTWSGISTGTSSGLLTVGGDGTMRWVNQNGIPDETRKLVGPGPSLKLLRDTARPLSAKDTAPDGYIQLARLVGARIPAEEAMLLDAIRELGLPVYDWDKVDQFLARKAKAQGTNVRWVWKPISTDGVKFLSALGWQERDMPRVGYLYAKLYGHKIPMSVLENMKAVLEKVPDALFLASDYEVINPDPFLAVTTKELLTAGKLVIIQVWLEPSFSDVAVPAKQSN